MDIFQGILLYADDMVLLAKTEDYPENMLNIVHLWCIKMYYGVLNEGLVCLFSAV